MSSPSTSRAAPTRKSLSAVVSNQKHHAAHRKRAKSIASGNPDELTPRSKRRRYLAPKKSILKQSNVPSGLSQINPLSSSQTIPPRTSQPLEDITMNFTRVSVINQDRRVSFAPNAHVRLIPKESQHTNDSSSPPSSPGDSFTDSANTSQENTRPAPDSPIKNDVPSRRMSQSTGGDGDGELSMDLASDTSYLDDENAEQQATPEKRRESIGSEGSSMDIDDSQVDMDMTMNTAVSGRPSIARPRRSSTRSRRESSTPKGSDGDNKRTEYTIPLEESLKGEVVPSANWLALQAVMNHHSEGPTSPPPNIDIETAAARLLLAGHDIPMPLIVEEADTTASSEGDSTGSISEKTMDFTAMSANIRRASMRNVTTAFPRASLQPPVPEPTASSGQTLPPFEAPKSSAIPAPASSGILGLFRSKVASFVPTPRSASSSPTKAAESSPIRNTQQSKPPSFSAAFAPASVTKPKNSLFTVTVPSSVAPKSPARQAPLKRPHPVDENTAVTESPSKKFIVAVDGGTKVRAIPKSTPIKMVGPSPSPGKKVTVVPRRPSDYLTRPNLSRLSSAFRHPAPPPSQPTTAASPERPSGAPLSATPTKAPVSRTDAPQTPETPVISQPSPKVSTPTVDCKRETLRQPDAGLRIASSPPKTPTARRSFVGTPLTSSPWFTKSVRASFAPSLRTEAEGDEEYEDEDETANILESLSEEIRARLPGSVDELLRSVGGEFMDNVVARRRSTMGVRSQDQYPDVPVTDADYAVAVEIDLPQLKYYDFIMSHLNNLIDAIEQKQSETDDIVRSYPPPCFIQYAIGGEDDLPELKLRLETIRGMVRLQTKVDWYRWRLEGITDLYAGVAKNEKEALEDLRITQTLLAEINPTLDYVEVQHAEIMAELERERATVVEIDKCDQKALAEVKSSIVDNATQLKMLGDEVAEIQKDINGSNRREEACRAEQKILQQKIDNTGKMVVTHSSAQSLFAQTKADISLIQHISGWKPLKVTPSRVNLEYDERILVSIPCKNWIPILESCDVRLWAPNSLHKPRQDWLPLFTKFTVDAARSRLLKGRFGKRSVRKIMDKISSFWTCCDVVRHEIMMLRSKYAVKLRYDPSQSADFTVEAPVLFAKSSSKVLIEFDFNTKILDKWPLSVPDVQARVKIGYVLDDNVTIDVDSLLATVNDRLRAATLAENFGILVDACADAASLYS